MNHDKLSALHVLDPVPTAIVVGDKDWLTPPEHSRAWPRRCPRRSSPRSLTPPT